MKVTVSRCVCGPRAHCATVSPGSRLLVQQGDLAVVTVVAAHLAVCLVEVGGIGEGRGEGVIVRGGVGVARRGEQGLGIRLGRRRRGVVVLILARRRSPAVAQGLSLGQLVAKRRYPLFFLKDAEREEEDLL